MKKANVNNKAVRDNNLTVMTVKEFDQLVNSYLDSMPGLSSVKIKTRFILPCSVPAVIKEFNDQKFLVVENQKRYISAKNINILVKAYGYTSTIY